MKLLIPLTVAAVIAAVAVAVLDTARFTAAWYPASFWLLDITLGIFLIRWIHDLTGGAWGAAVQPALRGAVAGWPVAFIVAMAVAWTGRMQLVWLADPAPVPGGYVAAGAAVLRTMIYGVVWSVLAFTTLGALRRHGRHPALGAVALILHLPLVTLFAVDWLMVLSPHWYSTIIGLNVLGGQFAAGLALVVLVQCLRHPVSDERASPDVLQDLGNLLLAAVMFAGYIGFMQYLIIWIGDLPHEVSWYLERGAPEWRILILLAAGFGLALPLVMLTMRRVKRHPLGLGAVAVSVLLGHLLYLTWQISPAYVTGGGIALWWLPVAVIGAGGLWSLAFLRQAGGSPQHG